MAEVRKITINGVTYNVAVETDTTLSKDGSPADAGATGRQLESVTETVEAIKADLNYKEITINSFTNSIAGTYEIGKYFEKVSLSWSLSKTPVSQTITTKDSSQTSTEDVDPRFTTSMYNNQYVHTNTTYTLKVTDERGATATKETSVTFVNGVYYGALDYGASIDSAVILGLTRKLQSGRSVSFTAGGGKRPTYALPTRYGTPTFKIGGFDYEWEKVKTFDFTNSSGYTESYDVWMHSQNVTDSVTVNVT